MKRVAEDVCHGFRFIALLQLSIASIDFLSTFDAEILLLCSIALLRILNFELSIVNRRNERTNELNGRIVGCLS